MRVWERFLTEEDKIIYSDAGFGTPGGFGRRPAVLIVDVTYSFCGHRPEPIEVSIKSWSHSCGAVAWEAISEVQRLLVAARGQRIPVFFTTGIDYRKDGFDAGGWKRKNHRVTEDGGVQGYGHNEIVREIAPNESEIVIKKLKPSAFHGTPLLGFLVDLQVDTLLICGTTTSGCVRASVIDAFSYNFKVGVVEGCTFDRGVASHAINLFDMNAKYADVISTEDAVRYIRSIPAGLFDDKIAFAGYADKS